MFNIAIEHIRKNLAPNITGCTATNDRNRGQLMLQLFLEIHEQPTTIERDPLENRTNDVAPVYLLATLPEAAAYHAATLAASPERYTKNVRLRLEMGRYVLAEDYVRAQAARVMLRNEVDAALDGCDALVLPTLPIPAPPIGAATVDVGGTPQPVRSMMLRLTQLFNLTGHPAISLPIGDTPAGLPCGLQLVGRVNGTERLLAAAAACEPCVIA